MIYVDTPIGRVPVGAVWLLCARCGEHFPATALRPAIGDEDTSLLCETCFELDTKEKLEALVSHRGWTKRFEDGQWYYYPPDEVNKLNIHKKDHRDEVGE